MKEVSFLLLYLVLANWLAQCLHHSGCQGFEAKSVWWLLQCSPFCSFNAVSFKQESTLVKEALERFPYEILNYRKGAGYNWVINHVYIVWPVKIILPVLGFKFVILLSLPLLCHFNLIKAAKLGNGDWDKQVRYSWWLVSSYYIRVSISPMRNRKSTMWETLLLVMLA